jgi:hypothetical protein
LSIDGLGDTKYPSTITVGTWSFDVYISDFSGTTNEIDILGDELGRFLYGIQISNLPYTMIEFHEYDKGVKIHNPEIYSIGEKITGWVHFDITLDNDGAVNIYLNGESVLKGNHEVSYEPHYFYFMTCCEGPALDNVVVRNQVIDIQPTE